MGFRYLARPVAYAVLSCRVVLHNLLNWHAYLSKTLDYPYTPSMYRLDMLIARLAAAALGGWLALWIYKRFHRRPVTT